MFAGHFSRKIIFLLICELLLLFFALPVMAIPVSETYGIPPINIHKNTVYRLWKDDSGWHLRWSSKKNWHVFSGRVWVNNGRVVLGKRIGLKYKDKIYKEENRILFFTKNKNHEKGFDFEWDGPSIYFDLKIDGVPLRKNVQVGFQGIHPEEMPFVIHPKIPPFKKRRPVPRHKIWVPGHYDFNGVWIPGHYRYK